MRVMLAMVLQVPLLASTSYRELVAPDTVQQELKGRVRTLEVQTHKIALSGRAVIWKKTITHFDRDGYLLDTAEMDVSGDMAVSVRYIYDEVDNLVAVETSEPKKEVIVVGVEIDYANNVVTMVTRRKGKPSLKQREFVFGASRMMDEVRDFDDKGKAGNVMRIERDAGGLAKEKVRFLAPKGRELMRFTSTRDERGIELITTIRSQQPEFTKTITYTGIVVDEAGNWIQMKQEGKAVFKDGGQSTNTPDDLVRVIEYYN